MSDFESSSVAHGWKYRVPRTKSLAHPECQCRSSVAACCRYVSQICRNAPLLSLWGNNRLHLCGLILQCSGRNRHVEVWDVRDQIDVIFVGRSSS